MIETIACYHPGMKRAAVLGAGAWGTALAKVLSDKGERVALWTHRPELAEQITDTHQNARYLPGVSLSPELIVTADLEKALGGCQLVVLAVPSHALREVMTPVPEQGCRPRRADCQRDQGHRERSLMLMREVMLDVRGPRSSQRLAYSPVRASRTRSRCGCRPRSWSPSSSADESRAAQERCANERLRIYASRRSGGRRARRRAEERDRHRCRRLRRPRLRPQHARRAHHARARRDRAARRWPRAATRSRSRGSPGMGDLVLTCTGELSRNRTVGFEMGRAGRSPTCSRRLGHVAEGVRTAKSAYDLGRKLGVDMPITTEVYRVLYEGKSPQQAVGDLMARALKPEF